MIKEFFPINHDTENVILIRREDRDWRVSATEELYQELLRDFKDDFPGVARHRCYVRRCTGNVMALEVKLSASTPIPESYQQIDQPVDWDEQ